MVFLLLVHLSIGPLEAAESEEDEDWGEEDDWGEDDDAGFSEPLEASARPAPSAPKPLHLGGTLQTEEAIWLENRIEPPLAKARQTADIWLDYKTNGLRSRISGHSEYDLAMTSQKDLWDEPTLDVYASQLLLRDAWAALDLGSTEILGGRSVVAWGEGRLLSLLDVVNPRDLREPGMVDLEDLRLPVTMLRVTTTRQGPAFWPGTHRFEAIAVAESEFGYRSPPLGPFGMFDGLIQEVELPASLAQSLDLEALMEGLQVDYHHNQTRWPPEQAQAFLRWTWRGRGIDLGLYGATVLDQQGLIELPELTELSLAATSDEPITIGLDHQRYQLLGHSGVLTTGSVLVRWEAVYRSEFPINIGELLNTDTTIPTLDVRTAKANLLGGLCGASWTGLDGFSVDIDLTKNWLLSSPEEPLFPMETVNWAARISKSLFKERLSLDAMAMGWGWQMEQGALFRAGANYELANAIHVNLGAISYQPGSERGPLLGLDSHDRLFGGLRWDF